MTHSVVCLQLLPYIEPHQQWTYTVGHKTAQLTSENNYVKSQKSIGTLFPTILAMKNSPQSLLAITILHVLCCKLNLVPPMP